MRFRFISMGAGLAVGITAIVVAACAFAAYLYSRHHFDSLLETARSSALVEGELIRTALEHQMMENDRTLIARMVESFGKQPNVERLTILDRLGARRFSSRPHLSDSDLQIDSQTCQACHNLPREQRDSSRVIETSGGEYLRTVVPIRNRAECHSCHDPGHSINGILVLDHSTAQLHAAINRDVRWMTLATGVLTLVLMGAIAILIRILVLRRLQRLESTARRLAAGDLNQRAPAEGSDTLAWLGREFNTMADSVTGLIAEVSDQRERLETVINSIDDGIVVLDPQRLIIAANDSFLQRVGRPRSAVLGVSCREFSPAFCSVPDCPAVSCYQCGGQQVRIAERRRNDGTVCWEEIHASPVRDKTGALVQVVEVWRDISERRAAEAHLAESHRLASLGYLASGFSHELNTPLATVLTCVEGILRDVPGESDALPSRIRSNAAVAREQLLRCRSITQHFLQMSRGRSSPGNVVVLRETIEAVRRLIDPTAREHAIEIDLTPCSESVAIRADEAELQQALVNLVLNAIQASRPGGKVRMAVQSPGHSHVIISVTDDGCGIPHESLKRIFEPFFGLRQGGTGLGLFLSLTFVRRWGGDIQVASTPGQGSRFEILLPCLEPVEEQRIPQ